MKKWGATMVVTLYTNSGDTRQLNKNLTTVATISNCQINDTCTILRPVLRFELNASYLGANYVYIPNFNRYYYIEDMTILNGSQIEISCRVDVLMSHRTAILNSYVIAARSASKPEPFMPDNCLSDKGTVTYYTRRASTTPFNGSSYVLTVAGK